MDTELTTLYINVNYLVSKLRKLERDNEIITKKYNRHIKEKEEEWDQYIEMKERNFKNEERIKELEERVGRIDELTNEVYDSRLDTEPTIGTVDFLEDSKNPNGLNSFKLNDKLYFATKRGFFKADYYVDPETEHTYEDVPLCISHEEYLAAASQSIKQEDPRDYPEEPSE
jgi:predicted nuclease with TOPRIM domain